MAFVFKAEKKDPDVIEAALPGPGQYLGQNAYTFTENRIGFHSSTTKEQAKPTQDPELGPGSYNIARDLLAADKTQNVFFMPADPDKEVEQTIATGVFKSKTRRFENNGNTENPGPGKYHKEQTSGKKAYPQPSSKLKIVQDMLQHGKTMIPSIPSNTHSYGYTENDEHELVLNQDPLAQAQQYVGPGYYEVKENPQGAKYKGPSWHKSGVKKLESFAKNTATSHTVGPGTYEAPEQNIPAFKAKPNAGFVSTSTRSFDAYVKQKLGGLKTYGKTPLSSQSEIGGRRLSAAETDIDSEDDEYLKEATPGPGYYYNESMLSSFSTKNSEFSSTGERFRGIGKPKLHGFGRTQRFKDQHPTTKEIGPGDYDVKNNAFKLEARAKVPFQSSNTRFERAIHPLQPGPGTYNAPLTLVDRVQDKAKSGYVGSFGITEKRFKISKLLEETPGPGTYIQDNQKSYVEDITAAFRKGSHYFTSTSQRKAFNGKNDNTAAPGSYNLTHFNIATKAARPEDDLGLPRNEPFSFGPERFAKPKEKVIPEDEDEDEDDDEPRFGATRNFDSLLKPKMKQKPNAVFASSTKRTISGQRKGPNPGPGSYYDSNQNMWNKRTFNIHFTGD